MKRTIIVALLSVLVFNPVFAKEKDFDAKAWVEKFALKADKAYKGYKVEREVVYKNYKGNDLGIDIIQPEKQLYKNGSPVIICIHGGGWGGGERYIISKKEIERYSKLGIALVPISYSRQTIEECVTDCFDVARFLALNAKKYNLDPNRFAISGHSAGGHLCLMLGLAPAELFLGDPALKDGKFKVLCSSAKAPISTLIDDEILKKYPRAMHRASFKRNIGVDFSDSYELRKKLSPIVYITKDSPKVQIIHGNVDEACPIEETIKTCDYAKSIGNEIEFLEVDGVGHGVRTSRLDEEEAFFSKYLLDGIEKL